MEPWLYILLILAGPSIIAFIINAIKDESETREKRKTIESINRKYDTGEELNDYEKSVVDDINRKKGIITDLLIREHLPNTMYRYDSVTINNQKKFKDLLRIIVWFNTSVEFVNYLIVKGHKTSVDLDYETVIIIQHLMKKLADKNFLQIEWLNDSKKFSDQLISARVWAENQKENLIFKYKANDNVKTEYHNFIVKLNEYKAKAGLLENTGKVYEEMTKQFLIFVSCL